MVDGTDPDIELKTVRRKSKQAQGDITDQEVDVIALTADQRQVEPNKKGAKRCRYFQPWGRA